MSLEFISDVLQNTGFHRLEMFLADGRIFEVTNREMIVVGPDSRSVSLFTPPRITETIDLSLIVSIRLEAATQ